MPSKTRRQQKFFFAELSKAKKGQKTKTGMSVHKLEEFTKLAKRKKKKRKK